jgi:nitrogen fixation/metabolism regulation signal transduction histidine kinase
LSQTEFPAREAFLDSIFGEVVFQIADEQNVNFRIYDLSGKLITSTQFPLQQEATRIPQSTLNLIDTTLDGHFIEIQTLGDEQYRSSFSYIQSPQGDHIGLLNLPYYDDDSLSAMELQNFLARLLQVYVLILGIAIILAYFVSKYITQSLQEIGTKINKIALNKSNQKILVERASKEISQLIFAYNSLVDQLEESAVKLAKSEREHAWREMAKQVAHEIKNPLTPMRLSVQSFEKQFEPTAPDSREKLADFSKTLIQQIDILSTIASAFSNFAQMPAQQTEILDVSQTTKLALEIFNDKSISFDAPQSAIYARLDRTQLIRVITNLVKNAVQACVETPRPKIEVRVFKKNQRACVSISDNGIGIPKKHADKIFEPKFTTKSSGMGLGLGMVKNIVETYDGTINHRSAPNKKTIFTVCFPLAINSES